VRREDSGLPAAAANADFERAPSVDERRVLVGLLGKGIQLSRTPAMHEAEGAAQGISYIYRLLDADRMGNATLTEIVDFAERFGFNGLNITFPYKQDILPLLTDFSEAASSLGSVNTVVFRDGRRFGHNTDMWGFKESFRRGLPDAARGSVLLIGAGGAGAAVGHALFDSGAGELLIADADGDRAAALATRLAGHFGAGRARAVTDIAGAAATVDGIANATPVGMTKLPGIPLLPSLLRADCWVADVIYFPLETQLLAEARKRGCRTLSGEGMAVYQAVRAFELFTGIAPDVDRMKRAFAAHGGIPAGERGEDWQSTIGGKT
jgi:shikimate dehydrogenase